MSCPVIGSITGPARPSPIPIVLAVGLVLTACGEGDAPAKRAPASTEAEGKRLFARNGCPVCHGDEGHGDGRMSPSLRPELRDLRDPEAYRQGHTAAEIARTIREGISTGRGGMPAYAHLSSEEREQIARYIASLQDR